MKKSALNAETQALQLKYWKPAKNPCHSLLRGVPFDVVKSMGRWSSDAFLIYLRQHAVIIAPYIQGTPFLEAFTRYTMPRPR